MARAARPDQLHSSTHIKAECLLWAVHVRHSGYGNCPLAVVPSPPVDIRDATIKEKGAAAVRASAACMPNAWYIAGMKKPLTVTEFARMGGKARAQKLSPERRKQIASEAGKKGGRPRKATLDNTT